MKLSCYGLGLSFWLPQAFAITLPEYPVQAYDCDKCELLSREPLTARWPVSLKNTQSEVQHQQISTRYYLETTLAKLQQGINISTTAPGAVIHLTASGHTLHGSSLRFDIEKNGRSWSFQEATEQPAGEYQIAPEQNGTLIKLKPELGFGNFTIKSHSVNSNGQTPVRVHVSEPASDFVLTVETDKAYYQTDDTLVATVNLSDKTGSYPIDRLTMSILTGNGQTITLEPEKIANNRYQAKYPLKSLVNPAGKSDYVEVQIDTSIEGNTIKRHGHTAFSYRIPSAAIVEIKQTPGQAFNFSAALNTATGSRYALQAVLYGTDKNGNLKGVETVQAAQWLPAGKSTIRFSFTEDIAKQLKAPYYVGSLQLIDYGQLKQVYHYSKLIEITQTA
ncbi:DUF4785 domain-containing protein [Legionella dresdenensis]|uniref:DUF4785 domain-containing protein n=1 Tax=Legionella dresdenensis TaxID=450200 RepID=A0ABV8CI17_9GAMM